ncbi:olfactory receptor 5AR1-like [Eleutherodactylus coqui]|uniref:olfactory receptor 5AR1-like n=1 Tax=Eleutherodactylus coqui TaxID=57060 RepID=UPI003461FAC1
MNDFENITVTEFYLTPFSTSRINEILIFIGFLFIYLLAVVGNLIIIVLICTAPQLHTPMYFFLCNLSSIDIIYVSAIVPKMLSIIITEDKTISFFGCLTQLYFFLFCAVAENNTLACMAYDRYVAVCSPLHYSLIMRKKVCFILATSNMVFSAVNSLMLTIMIATISFCYSDKINHFFCESRSLIALSFSDTTGREIVVFVEDICLIVFTFMLILTSYVRIISAILRMHSARGRLKAFTSCSSHIITVLLFYGPSTFVYLKPESKDSEKQDKILSMFYIAVVPMLNPFVYSLRNKEVLGAIRKLTKTIKQIPCC